MKKLLTPIVVFFFFYLTTATVLGLPSFRTAEGWGADNLHARGKKVYKVTSLGGTIATGTLPWALAQAKSAVQTMMIERKARTAPRPLF